MKTGLTKSQKDTQLWFREEDSAIYVRTYNVKLKFSRGCPDYCQFTDDNEQGCMQFEVDRNRFSFRFTKPYSAERKNAQSARAKTLYTSNGGIGKRKRRVMND